MPPIEKLCPVLLRSAADGLDILVFWHPQAGIQLVKGTREAGEAISSGALRELAEESGIASAMAIAGLGSSVDIMPGQLWHFIRAEAHDLPDAWSFDTLDGGGHRFAFFWWPLAREPGADWHGSFVCALHHIRAALG